MENVIKKLRLEFCLIFIWAAVLIGLFEWDVWTAGWAVGNELADYYINLTGIIMVIVLVPMALKMMSFRVVKSSYSVDFPQRSGLKYKRWSEVRILLSDIGLNRFYLCAYYSFGFMFLLAFP